MMSDVWWNREFTSSPDIISIESAEIFTFQHLKKLTVFATQTLHHVSEETRHDSKIRKGGDKQPLNSET